MKTIDDLLCKDFIFTGYENTDEGILMYYTLEDKKKTMRINYQQFADFLDVLTYYFEPFEIYNVDMFIDYHEGHYQILSKNGNKESNQYTDISQ